MRLFAIVCFAIAVFYGYTAVDAMRRGVTTPMRGESVVHHRDDPQSKFNQFLMARWLAAGGFLVMGVVMHIFAGRFETLARNADPKS